MMQNFQDFKKISDHFGTLNIKELQRYHKRVI